MPMQKGSSWKSPLAGSVVESRPPVLSASARQDPLFIIVGGPGQAATEAGAQLADALWGDALPAHPADQVGVLVSRLRGVLVSMIDGTTVAYALGQAVDGDTIHLAAGIYTEDGGLVFDKSVEVYGAGPGETVLQEAPTFSDSDARLVNVASTVALSRVMACSFEER